MDRTALPLARPTDLTQPSLVSRRARVRPTTAVGADRATLYPMLGAIWILLTLPFRIVAGVFDFLSRALGLVLGFALMVAGVALGAGPSLIVGVPIFVVGLVITLRCLD